MLVQKGSNPLYRLDSARNGFYESKLNLGPRRWAIDQKNRKSLNFLGMNEPTFVCAVYKSCEIKCFISSQQCILGGRLVHSRVPSPQIALTHETPTLPTPQGP